MANIFKDTLQSVFCPKVHIHARSDGLLFLPGVAIIHKKKSPGYWHISIFFNQSTGADEKPDNGFVRE
jgi:hypothetical protein